MLSLLQLQQYLNELLVFDKSLPLEKIDPIMANGLVIEGKKEVGRVGFGVSASAELFTCAKQLNCEAIVVHHVFNFPPFNRFDAIFQKRIGFLLENKISLFGFHFLMDAHPQIGNNAQILKIMGAKLVKPYLHQGNPWGWVGQIENGKDLLELEKELEKHVSKRAIFYHFGPKMIKRIVAISGSGAPYASQMQDLIDDKIDLFITGEAHEWNRELFKEAKINFIAGGHYATEVFGVKKLMEKVKEKFPSSETIWLDVYNEI